MFKEPFDILNLESHTDDRGTLFEILRFKDQGVPGGGYLYCFSVNPGQRRGDHYHEKKQEWFTCVSGEVVVLLEDKDNNKKKIILSAGHPAIVYCGPYTSHALYNESKLPAVVVSYGSAQHDPDNPDTYRKFIEYEDL